MTEMTFSRPFSIMPHIWPSFFWSPVILPVYLQMTKIVTGDNLCFADKFHQVERYVSHFCCEFVPIGQG